MSWYKLLAEDSLKEGGHGLIVHERGKEDAEDGFARRLREVKGIEGALDDTD